MRKPIAIAAACGLALTLGACSSKETPEKPQAAATVPVSEFQWPVIKGGFGTEPSITFEGKPGPSDLATKVLVKGKGEEVGENDFIVADYKGVVWNGKEFDSSFKRGGPAGFSLNGVIKGWKQGLAGKHVGDRVALVIPGPLAYGPTPPPGGVIEPNATLTFVVDIVKAVKPDAVGDPGKAQTITAPVEITGAPGSPASIKVTSGAPEPTEAKIEVVVAGKGPKIQVGQSVVLQQSSADWANAKTSSTWGDSGPLAAEVQGDKTNLTHLFEGISAGSRVVITAPANKANAQPAFALLIDIVDTFGPRK